MCIAVYEPGGQRVVINEQTRLLQDRYEFTLFTEHQRAEAPPWLPVVRTRPWQSRYNPIPIRALRLALTDFDLIHCHDSFAYIWEASKTGKPLAVTSHGNCPARYRAGLRLKAEYYISEPIYGIAYRRADQVIAISEYIRIWLRRRYGVNAALCYNGVDTVRFSPGNIVREPAFLYVGEQSARKGVPALVRAFLSYRRRHMNYHLWLVGYGPMVHELSNLSDVGIDFLGFVGEEELVDRYRRCAAFVTASHWEGFGLPILEAFGTATPVVARRGYAITELVGGSRCGVLFSTDKDLSGALGSVTSLLPGAGKEARQIAENFSWSRSASCLHEIYAGLLARSAGVYGRLVSR